MSISIDDIKTLVRLQLGIAEVEAEDELARDLGAVSADIVNIVVAIEDKYGVEIDEDALSRVRTVGDLVTLVERKLAP